MSDSLDLVVIRTQLDAERARVVAMLAHLHAGAAVSLDDETGEVAGRGNDNHLADMATVTVERELEEGIEEGAQQTLEQVERALARLDEGTYGACERCGEPIGAERLAARPWATLCIDDQRRA
ncbi:MAG: TraR/DksA C4-type zinc finger protein [Actinomycetes bacterium]